MEKDPSGAFLAVAKKDFLKAKKGGKGVGKKGDECGAEDHISTACPIRLERVAAGGPETHGMNDAAAEATYATVI